jgi:peroxiredoxin
MKKYLLIFSLFFSFGVVSAQDPGQFELKGHIEGLKTGTMYLQKFTNKYFSTVDSSVIINGNYSFRTKLVLPELYGLTLNESGSPVYVFLEDKKMTVNSDSAAFNRSTKLTGSASNDLFLDYKKLKDVKINDFIKANPASIVSAYALYRDFSYLLTSEEIAASLKLLDPALQQTAYVRALKDLAAVKKKVEPGHKALDFTSTDQYGKTVKLSDQYGKYLLLDFWAAWCPDCRKENPNLVKTYQKYHDKGLDILGVSLDKDKATWLKGIKNDNLNWKHVSDLAYWDSAAAKLYGVRWIPWNFLIGPDGVIVAQNLQGDALDKKLEELLGAQSTASKAIGK